MNHWTQSQHLKEAKKEWLVFNLGAAYEVDEDTEVWQRI